LAIDSDTAPVDLPADQRALKLLGVTAHAAAGTEGTGTKSQLLQSDRSGKVSRKTMIAPCGKGLIEQYGVHRTPELQRSRELLF
jgi:hypothetical protein